MGRAKAIIWAAITSSLCAMLVLFVYHYGVMTWPDSFPSAKGIVFGWFQIHHHFLNTITLWRFDPILAPIVRMCGVGAVFAAISWFFVFGVAILFWSEGKSGSQMRICTAAGALLLCFVLLFGFDTVLLGSLCWYPFLLIALRIHRSLGWAGYLLLGVCSLLLASGNGAVALILAILALLDHGLRERKEISFAELLIVALPAILSLLSTPFPDFPNYPPYARIFPEQVLLSALDPLVGEAPPIRTIDRLALGQMYLPWGLALLGIVAIEWIAARWHKTQLDRRSLITLGTSAALALMVLLDSSLVSEQIQLLAPLYAVSRMIPGLVLIPLAPFALALGLFALFRFQVQQQSCGSKFCVPLPILVLALLLVAGKEYPLTKVVHLHNPLAELNGVSDPAGHAWLESVMRSPSFQLAARYGVEGLLRARHVPQDTFQSLSDFGPTLTSSHNQERLYHLLEAGNKRRWTLLKGKQAGDEWIHIAFRRARTFSGLQLQSGEFHSDFPRGIAVEIAESCDPQKSDFSKYRSVFRNPHWQGALNFTVDGYPYLAPESDVEIRFGEVVTAQCVLIRQIGSDPHFDWSVTQIDIALHE